MLKIVILSLCLVLTLSLVACKQDTTLNGGSENSFTEQSSQTSGIELEEDVFESDGNENSLPNNNNGNNISQNNASNNSSGNSSNESNVSNNNQHDDDKSNKTENSDDTSSNDSVSEDSSSNKNGEIELPVDWFD